MIPKPLHQITEEVLNSLIENKVAERKDLDYKRDLPERNDEKKREFLSDVSSFANTIGGDLIFGIYAPSGDGAPVDIPGIPTDQLENAKLWIEDVLRTGLQPRLMGHGLHTVSLASGRAVLIIRIPKSWASPHRVIFRGHGHFYARNSSGKYRLDVPELRNAFLLSESVAERIRNFRMERVALIKSGQTPLPLYHRPKLLFHILPLAAFSGTRPTDFSRPLRGFLGESGQAGSGLSRVKPFSTSFGWNQHVNLEGRIVFPSTLGSEAAGRSYTQFFRSGALEAVISLETLEHSGRVLARFDEGIDGLHQFIPAHLSALRDLGVELPFYVFLSIIDIGGAFLFADSVRTLSEQAVGPSDILPPEFTVEMLPVNTAEVFRESLETIWNAAGNDFCPYFKPGLEAKWWNES